MVKNMEDILGEGFKNLARDIEDFSIKIDLRDLEIKIKESKGLEDLKKQHDLNGLRFFQDYYYSSYLCVTDEDCDLLRNQDLSSIEITSKDGFHQLLSKTKPSIKFISTGKTYDNLDDLKKDYLTLKLAGV